MARVLINQILVWLPGGERVDRLLISVWEQTLASICVLLLSESVPALEVVKWWHTIDSLPVY